MKKEKNYIDIHVRVEIADLKDVDGLVAVKAADSRTAFIREAVKRLVREKKGKLVKDQSNLVLRQLGLMDEEIKQMLITCWRAAAESMYIDLEIYRQSTPQEIKDTEWERLREEAKKASARWVAQMKEASLIDLALVKHGSKRAEQISLPGISLPEGGSGKKKS